MAPVRAVVSMEEDPPVLPPPPEPVVPHRVAAYVEAAQHFCRCASIEGPDDFAVAFLVRRVGRPPLVVFGTGLGPNSDTTTRKRLKSAATKLFAALPHDRTNNVALPRNPVTGLLWDAADPVNPEQTAVADGARGASSGGASARSAGGSGANVGSASARAGGAVGATGRGSGEAGAGTTSRRTRRCASSCLCSSTNTTTRTTGSCSGTSKGCGLPRQFKRGSRGPRGQRRQLRVTGEALWGTVVVEVVAVAVVVTVAVTAVEVVVVAAGVVAVPPLWVLLVVPPVSQIACLEMGVIGGHYAIRRQLQLFHLRALRCSSGGGKLAPAPCTWSLTCTTATRFPMTTWLSFLSPTSRAPRMHATLLTCTHLSAWSAAIRRSRC